MRYRTLIKENQSLNAIYEEENQRLDKMRQRMMAYEKEGGSTIFRLGNEIAGKTSELDKIKMEIKSL